MDNVEVLGALSNDVQPRDQGVIAQEVTTDIDAVETASAADTEQVSPTTSIPPATVEQTSPVATVTPRSEKRRSQLPVPGSRLPMRKSSNPSLASEIPTAIPRSPSKSPRLSLPTPKLQTGLRRPSAGGISPVRSPVGSNGGLSPGLRSQGSNSSLRSPGTPTRIGLPKSPGAPPTQARSVSTSAASPRTLPKPAGTPTMGNRRASGLPTITKTPSREFGNKRASIIGLPTPTASPISVTKTTAQPKKTPLTPKLASRKSLPAGGLTVTPATPDNTTTKSTLAARTPLRSRSFQSVAKPLTPKLAPSAVTPKPVSLAPKSGSIKIAKPRSRPSIAPAEAEPVDTTDKRQRAMASSQALRDTIAAAKAARKMSGASKGNNWPEVIIAGIDDKKPEDEKEKDDYPYSDDSDAPPEEEEKPKGLDIRPGGILDLTYKSLEDFNEDVVAETNTVLAKVLLLQRNSLSVIPTVLTEFSALYTLDLSCNAIKGDTYLSKRMSFPYLKTLLIHTNNITSLDPILEYLDMPRLNYLDVHANKLTSYPKGLTRTFISLTTFVASDNQIADIELDGLEGLQVLDLMNNAITTLPPKLGLFENLRELRVLGNLFRVPRRQVLERSTTEVLEWLRDKIPEGERFLGSAATDAEAETDGTMGDYEDAVERWDVVGRDEVQRGRGFIGDADLD